MSSVIIDNFPPAMAQFLRDVGHVRKSVAVFAVSEGYRYRAHYELSDDGSRAYVSPTFLVHMTSGQWKYVSPPRLGHEPHHDDLPELTSGQAIFSRRGWGADRPLVTMLKSDLDKLIKVETAEHMDNPLVRSMLYTITKIRAGKYRTDAKNAIIAKYGKDAIVVAIDALLSEGLATVNKAGAVTATPRGLQIAAQLKYADDPTY